MWKKGNKGNTVEEVNRTNMLGKPVEPANSRDVKVTNLDVLAKWLLHYAKAKLPFYLVGDFDCDGICATAEMHILLGMLGIIEIIRTPLREEGYGMSAKIVSEFKRPGVIITVDNGVAAHEAIDEAKRRGFIVLVVDHHEPKMSNGKIDLPNADLIVDPHIPDELISRKSIYKSGYRDYCGAGLVCKLAQLLVSNKETYGKIAAFAAIATIADVVPLTGDNRAIYKEGIRAIKERNITPGLQKLIDILRSDNKVSEKDIGFRIAPMLNAPGRVLGDSSISVQALLANSYSDGFRLVMTLNEINERRKTLKEQADKRAEAYISEHCLYGNNPIVVYDSGVLPGVAGLVAGDIAEKHYVSSIVLTDSDDPEIIKGSCRAPYGNIKEALDKVHDAHPEYFAGYGGHQKAAGVSIVKKHLDDFNEAMQEAMGPAMERDDDVEYDVEITPDKIEETVYELEKGAPYGEENPPIIIKVSKVKLSPKGNSFFEKIGEDSVKFVGAGCEFVGFGMRDKYMDERMPKTVDVVGEISTRTFAGKSSIQVEMLDFVKSETEEVVPTELGKDIFQALDKIGIAI